MFFTVPSAYVDAVAVACPQRQGHRARRTVRRRREPEASPLQPPRELERAAPGASQPQGDDRSELPVRVAVEEAAGRQLPPYRLAGCRGALGQDERLALRRRPREVDAEDRSGSVGRDARVAAHRVAAARVLRSEGQLAAGRARRASDRPRRRPLPGRPGRPPRRVRPVAPVRSRRGPGGRGDHGRWRSSARNVPCGSSMRQRVLRGPPFPDTAALP